MQQLLIVSFQAHKPMQSPKALKDIETSYEFVDEMNHLDKPNYVLW